jgi:cephalosporin-C deacetylase-like acetyl esterase
MMTWLTNRKGRLWMRQIVCLAVLTLAAILVHWAGEAELAAPAPMSHEELVKLLDYDRAASVDLQIVGSEDLPGGQVVIQDVTYPSPVSGRVTAYLVAPKSPAKSGARRAGIVFLHWGQGDRSEFIWEASLYARAGAVSILVDAPWNRPEPWKQVSEGYLSEPDLVRGMCIQIVKDLRRAIDVLLARGDVDEKRLAYVGHSFGATWGGTLAAVEKRFATHILMGGLPRLTDFETKGPPAHEAYVKLIKERLTPEQLSAYVGAIDPISSLYFIRHAPPASVFMQFALFDAYISKEAATIYYEAARDPKEIAWYPTSHEFSCVEALADRATWLEKKIGIGSTKALLEASLRGGGAR